MTLVFAVQPPQLLANNTFFGFSHNTDRKVPSEVVLMGSFMSVICGNFGPPNFQMEITPLCKLLVVHLDSQSPAQKQIVASTIRSWIAEVNLAIMTSLTSISVTLVNILTNLLRQVCHTPKISKLLSKSTLEQNVSGP